MRGSTNEMCETSENRTMTGENEKPEIKEKLVLRFTDTEFVIERVDGPERETIRLSPGEALMVLDILKHEEENLREKRKDTIAIPITIS